MHLDALFHDIASLGLNLHDMALITPDGLFSHTFQPCSICHNGYSVAKVFTATAVGLLFDGGLISPDDRIADFFAIPAHADPRWHEVTIDHLLRHQSGIDHGFLDIDAEDTAQWPTDDYLSIVFAQPLPHAPGTYFQYSDGVFYLLSRLVSRVAMQPMDALLHARLLRPLRFGETAWSRCPYGYPIGATGLYCSAADLAKLGWLYLNGGKWNGKQLLSAQWVRLTLERGYTLKPSAQGNWISKGGMYGQRLAFSPHKQIAVAWHAFESQPMMEKILAVIDAQ